MFKYWAEIKKNTFFKLAVAGGVSYVLYLLAGFLLPILLSVWLAFALYPLVGKMMQIPMAKGTFHLPHVAAIILALLAFLGGMLLIIVAIILPLFGQMNAFLHDVQPFLKHANADTVGSILEGKMPVLPSNLQMLFDNGIDWAMAFVSTVLQKLLKSSLDIVQNLFGLIIVPFLAFYFLKDWRQLRGMLVNFFNYDDQPQVERVLDEIGMTLSAYVSGLFKLSMLSGFVIMIGTMCMGVNLPLVLAFMAIIAESVPVVGPLMGAVPAVFIAYRQSPELAMWVAVFYVVYYQLDANYIMPRIMGEKLDLHPVLIIGSLLIGAKLFGIIGMVFAVPVAAVYRVLYKELWHAEDTV